MPEKLSLKIIFVKISIQYNIGLFIIVAILEDIFIQQSIMHYHCTCIMNMFNSFYCSTISKMLSYTFLVVCLTKLIIKMILAKRLDHYFSG